MLKRPLAFFLGAAILGAGAYFLAPFFIAPPPAQQQDIHISQNATLSDGSEETLDQSLKSISLSQGEGGFEIWRLKAEWANVLQQGEKILVESPKLTYFDKENPEKPLYVSSNKGDIEQKSQILRFIDNVHIVQEDRQIDGALLIYNGTSKTMTFPDGGNFTGTGMEGRADHIVWDINKKIIKGTGGINIFFEQKKDDTDPGSTKE